jgi:UDP-2,4-diacetamido-2,4,6-trideoxy-beta-L-altropyranose hydrolase
VLGSLIGSATQRLFVRADAGTQMGTGHIMRCLALAQAWQDEGGQCTFLTSAQGNPLLGRLHDEGLEVRLLERVFPDPADLRGVTQALAENPAAWLVLDGYHFDDAYQQGLRRAGARLLVVDDEGRLPAYHADFVLNQNLHAEAVDYVAPGARLLRGPRFALLRRQFKKWRDWNRTLPEVARKLLITMGGADLDNVTFKVLQALKRLGVRDWEALIVIGAANPHGASLEVGARECPFPARLERGLLDMPAAMAWADIAVAAAGSTCWELCFMGLPSILIELAANQAALSQQLDVLGAAQNAGPQATVDVLALADWLESLAGDSRRRAVMSRAGRQVVDGHGASRVVDAIRSQGPAVLLRRAGDQDCRAIWEWANDPLTRAASFSAEPIPWDKHVDWYQTKLGDPSCLLYLVTDPAGESLGMVRYDAKDGEAVVSINLAPASRGRGLGPIALRLSAHRVFAESNIQTIIADIKPDNRASVAAFQRAGYQAVVGARGALRFRFERKECLP